MAKRELPPANLLRQLLCYEPESGFLYWRPRPTSMFISSGKRGADEIAKRWNTRYAGQRALFTSNSRGALFGGVLGQQYLAHRIAWTIYHGKPPAGVIDHINGDGTDNRIANLRDVSLGDNSRNQALHKNNTSGYSGVDWREKEHVWRCRIYANGKRISIGLFKSKADAIIARRRAEEQIGFHANHGKRQSFRNQ